MGISVPRNMRISDARVGCHLTIVHLNVRLYYGNSRPDETTSRDLISKQSEVFDFKLHEKMESISKDSTNQPVIST